MTTPADEAGGSEGYPGEDGPTPAEVSTRRIEVLNLALVALASAASLVISKDFAAGVVAGGLLMAANFRVIVGVIRAVFLKGSTRLGNVVIYWLKFAGVMALVGVLILVFQVDAVGFLVGSSTLLVAITAEAVLRLARR